MNISTTRYRSAFVRSSFVALGVAISFFGTNAWSQSGTGNPNPTCGQTTNVCYGGTSTNVTLLAIACFGNDPYGNCCQAKYYSYTCVNGPDPTPPATLFYIYHYAPIAGDYCYMNGEIIGCEPD